MHSNEHFSGQFVFLKVQFNWVFRRSSTVDQTRMDYYTPSRGNSPDIQLLLHA